MRPIVPIVLFAAAACVLPRPDDVEFLDDDPTPTTSDDDDNAGDDDDADPTDDDDVAPDPEDCADGVDNDLDGLIDCNDPDCADDEACTGTPLPPCSGVDATYQESEPNDRSGQVNPFPEHDGAFTIYGYLAGCGNDGMTYTDDLDIFMLRFTCSADFAITVQWENRTDIDFSVVVPKLDDLTVWSRERSTFPPEQGVLDFASTPDVSGNGTLDFAVAIACWSGEPGSYVATVSPL